MTDAPPTYSEFNSASEASSKAPTTENIAPNQAPRYGFINPAALGNTTHGLPGTIQYQPHMGAPGYGGRPAYLVTTPPGMYSTTMPEINSYQAWSILNILCCCWIFGCIACHYSSETESLRARGDIPGAMNASKNARTMNIIATVGGLAVIIIVIILFTTGVISQSF